MEALIYLFKAGVILLFFYMIYIFLLKDETFFRSNRQFLLTGIVASFLAPLLVLKRTVYKEMPAMDFDFLSDANTQVATNAENEPSIDFWQIASLIYGVGLAVMLVAFGRKLYQIFSFIKSSRQYTSNGFRFVQVDGLESPFSFFNTIVLDARAHSEEDLEMIIMHEQEHARQNHSIDVLLVQLALTAQWFNPVAWLYKNAVIENLEYLADAATVNQVQNQKSYQLALVKVAAPKLAPALTNSFYQSFIKKRIVMLNKQSSSEFRKWKMLLVVPILGAFMWSFNVKEEIRYTSEKALSTTENTAAVMYLTSSSNAEELLAIEQYFKTEIPQVDLKIQEVKRDASGKITGFAIYTRFEGEDDFKKNLELKAEDEQTEAFEYALSYNDSSIAIVDVKNGITKTIITKDGVQGFVLDAKVKNALSSPSENTAEMSLPEIIEDAPAKPSTKTQRSRSKPFKKIITASTSESEIKAIVSELDTEYDVAMRFSRLKYNDAGEISRIKIEVEDRKTGNKASASYNRDENAIIPIAVYRSADGTFGVVSGQNSIVQRSAMAKEELEQRRAEMELRRAEMEERREEMMLRREEMMETLKDSTEWNAEMKARMQERQAEMEKRKEEIEARMEERRAEMQEREEELRIRVKERMLLEADSVFVERERPINASEYSNATNKQSQNIYYRVRQPQNASNVIYVLDGKVIEDKDFDFKSIDVKTIESINVLKGKESTKKYKKYIDDDTEGVIEINTKKSKKD